VPEVLRATRRQLRKGAEVIKLCASGGVLSALDNPYHQQFTDEELSAIVEEARRADRYV
jgi:imidazolonepropionase-like amidohydrolase